MARIEDDYTGPAATAVNETKRKNTHTPDDGNYQIGKYARMRRTNSIIEVVEKFTKK